jgi:hypothetical protein
MAPAIGAALSFDLTVTLPVATWWFGARKNRISKRAPWIVLGLGLVAARFLLPADARVLLRVLSVALEVGLIVAVVRSGRIRENFLPARLLAAELDVIGWAFRGWLLRTPREDEKTFSLRAGQYATVIGLFVFLIAAETSILHLIVSRWSPLGAWITTGLSLWGALWLIGDAHALRMQPLRISDDGIAINLGVRWKIFIPKDAIASIGAPDETRALQATVLGRKDVLIRTHRKLTAIGLFGRKREFDALVISLDRPEEFLLKSSGRRSP